MMNETSRSQRLLIVAGENVQRADWHSVIALQSALGSSLQVALIPSATGARDEGEHDNARLVEVRSALAEAVDPPSMVTLLPSRSGRVAGVAALAAAREPTLVVLLGVGYEGVSAAKDVAHAWRLPVLVARTLPLALESVMVATSLTEEDLPVVQMAARLTTALGGRLVIAHAATDATGASVATARRWLDDHASQLEGEMQISVDVMLTEGQAPTEAVLELARVEGRLIVLGSYPRSWITAWLIPSVCDAILEQTAANVVIVPLGSGVASGEPA